MKLTLSPIPYFVLVGGRDTKLHIKKGYTGGHPDNIEDISNIKQEETPEQEKPGRVYVIAAIVVLVTPTPTGSVLPCFFLVGEMGTKFHIDMGYRGGHPNNIQDIINKQEGRPEKSDHNSQKIELVLKIYLCCATCLFLYHLSFIYCAKIGPEKVELI